MHADGAVSKSIWYSPVCGEYRNRTDDLLTASQTL